MAGGRSPWGGKRKPEAEAGEAGADLADPPEGSDPAGVPESDGAQADAPAKAGPRNPWLPESAAGDTRRSARIDEILRQRGEGPSGGGFPGFPGFGNARPMVPWLIAGAALLLALSTSVQVLDQGQQGIVTTLGRYNRTIGPGFSLTLPWPLEAVAVRGKGGSVVTALPGNDGDPGLLTREGELIEVTSDLRWRITDARAFTAAFVQPDAAIAAMAQAELRAGVAELPFDDLWNGSRQKELEHRVAGRLQRKLAAMRAGVSVESLSITRASPPASLSAAFDKVADEREKANKLRLDSEKWAQQLIANSQSEASAFNRVYDQYKLAPEVVRRRMYYQTMERVLKNNQRVIVGGTGASGDLAVQGAN
jgi:membrane protease subunit HflK